MAKIDQIIIWKIYSISFLDLRDLSGSEIYPSEKMDHSLEEILTSCKVTSFCPVYMLYLFFVTKTVKALASVQLFAPLVKVRTGFSCTIKYLTKTVSLTLIVSTRFILQSFFLGAKYKRIRPFTIRLLIREWTQLVLADACVTCILRWPSHPSQEGQYCDSQDH